jgi:hypothetical protein
VLERRIVLESRATVSAWLMNPSRSATSALHMYAPMLVVEVWTLVAPSRVLGFSPANTPGGGYAAYGVDAIGMNPDGYPSNEDNTLVNHGFAGCPGRGPQSDPPRSACTNGVVTPHAPFLALRYAPQAAMIDVEKLARDFPGLHTKWGFRDSVNIDSGVVSSSYPSLDQGMIMAAVGNALGDDFLRSAFAGPDLERTSRPVIGIEEFGAGPHTP